MGIRHSEIEPRGRSRDFEEYRDAHTHRNFAESAVSEENPYGTVSSDRFEQGERLMYHTDSLRGQFLLASKRLRDPNFFRAAVLLLEHNEEGAMGVIVNRPSSVYVAHALSGHFNVPQSEDVIYVGGPVEPSALSMLHSNPAWGDREMTVIPGVFAGSSAEAFEQIVTSGSEHASPCNYRIYSGYSGWGEGQLESEIARGDWFTVQASASQVFDTHPYEVWDHLLREFQRQHRILPIPCDKAEWN